MCYIYGSDGDISYKRIKYAKPSEPNNGDRHPHE